MRSQLPVYGIAEFSAQKKDEYFYVNELRAHLENHQFVNSPHKHSTYITVLFSKGSGEHQIDFETYPIKPGSVFLLSPGQVHCWKLSNDVEGFVFFHTKEFYDSIFLKKKIDQYPFFYLQQNYPVIYLSKEGLTQVEPLFAAIYKESTHLQKWVDSKIETLVDLVYLELAQLYRNNAPSGHESHTGYAKVKALQKLIDQHFRIDKFPTEYAERLHMTTRHLSRICREVLNKSTGELIAERIIIEAKRLLIQKNTNVSMVADELGYDDYSYFIRMFKKNTGVSPKEFQSTVKFPFQE